MLVCLWGASCARTDLVGAIDRGDGTTGATDAISDVGPVSTADAWLADADGDPDPGTSRSCFPRVPFQEPMDPITLGDSRGLARSHVLALGDDLLVVRPDRALGGTGVYLGRRSRSGDPIGAEVHMATSASVHQPRVVAVDGGLLLAYTSADAVWVAPLDTAGRPAGTPRQVSERGSPWASLAGFVSIGPGALAVNLDTGQSVNPHELITLDAGGAQLARRYLSFLSGEDRVFALTPSGEDIGIVWGTNVTPVSDFRMQIVFATIDPSGTLRVAPVAVDTIRQTHEPSLSWIGDRWALVYSRERVSDPVSFDVFLTLISPEGAILGEPRMLSDGVEDAAFPSAAWDGRALAVAWRDRERGDLGFLLVDPAGNATESTLVAEDPSGLSVRPETFWVGDRYALTWDDFINPADDQEGSFYRHQLVVTPPCE